ncbi:87_t:CDS:2 [Funneliformis caledonium]|uniref:87_t:CDS:1 n=1 Tax=Funneliformis caledonium TaxID=1117310 RepID=A0A9N9CJJ6_9GLOM|nr:87_t:CDS:2 [Funneliformis caledonium]
MPEYLEESDKSSTAIIISPYYKETEETERILQDLSLDNSGNANYTKREEDTNEQVQIDNIMPNNKAKKKYKKLVRYLISINSQICEHEIGFDSNTTNFITHLAKYHITCEAD